MKKFAILLFALTLALASCTNRIPGRKLTNIMQNALGQDIRTLDLTLREAGFIPATPADYKLPYEFGDTLMIIIPEGGAPDKVGGILLTINVSDPEKAMKLYHEFRNRCKEASKDRLPFYGTKIIYNQPYSTFSSTDPITIDTIKPNDIVEQNINFNERWTDDAFPENRNSITLMRDQQLGTWRVNMGFRNSFSLDF